MTDPITTAGSTPAVALYTAPSGATYRVPIVAYIADDPTTEFYAAAMVLCTDGSLVAASRAAVLPEGEQLLVDAADFIDTNTPDEVARFVAAATVEPPRRTAADTPQRVDSSIRGPVSGLPRSSIQRDLEQLLDDCRVDGITEQAATAALRMHYPNVDPEAIRTIVREELTTNTGLTVYPESAWGRCPATVYVPAWSS